jgi:hypothetical protein
MLTKLVKFAELCWKFGSHGRFQGRFFLLKNAEHRVSTGETTGTSALPGRKFRLIGRGERQRLEMLLDALGGLAD